MKYLTIIVFAVLLLCTSCEFLVECDPYDYPEPPYELPDRIDTYENETFHSVTYVYYCYDGRHREVEYSIEYDCDSWLRSDFSMKCSK